MEDGMLKRDKINTLHEGMVCVNWRDFVLVVKISLQPIFAFG